jgi:hypothetical protein
MTLTANQPLAAYEARAGERWSRLRTRAAAAADASLERVPFEAASDAMAVVLRPMEVRTFLVDFTLAPGVGYAA